MWHDERLTWKPEDYGGLTYIVVPPTDVWLPCFVLYNTASDRLYFDEHYTRFKIGIFNTGTVVWAPGGKYTTICNIDVWYYPFDDQVCEIVYMNWMYSGNQVNLNFSENALEKMFSVYFENNEWGLLDKYISREGMVVDNVSYPEVHFKLHMQRKPLFYIVTIIIPSAMLSFLVLLVFRLPPDSGEKISMGVTLLLSYSVLILMVSENLPRTSVGIPLLELYLLVCMGHTSLTVCLSVITLALHHSLPEKHPPGWLLRFADWSDARQEVAMDRSAMKPLPTITDQNDVDRTVEDLCIGNGTKCASAIANSASGDLLIAIGRKILTRMERQETEAQELEHREKIKLEWKKLSTAIDRLLFWVFLTIIAIAAVIFFFIIPIVKSPQVTW